MATISHDQDGFLLGPKISADLGKLGRDIKVLREIRADTKETVSKLSIIADALTAPVARRQSAPPTPNAPPTVVPAAVVRAIREGLAASVTPGNTEKSRPPRRVRTPPDTSSVPGPPKQERQSNGRFGAGNNPGGPSGGGNGAESTSAKAMSAASESMRGVASGLAHGADNIDPTVQAAKELGGIISPVMGILKPFGRLFGGRKGPEEKRQRENVKWYRRIVTAASGSGGKSGGMGMIFTALLSVLGMLLAPIKALASMLGVFRALAGLGALLKGVGRLAGVGRGRGGGGRGPASRRGGGSGPASRPGSTGRPSPRPGSAGSPNPRTAPGGPNPPGGGKGGIGGFLSKGMGALGKGGMGLLKKIPFIGKLFAVGALASAVMAKEDPNATPEEKQQAKSDKYGAIGGIAGGTIGAVLGSALGPVGTIVGGIVGDYIGEKIGSFVSTVDFSALSTMVSDTFTSLADSAGKAASDAFAYLKTGWTGLLDIGSKTFTKIGDLAKDAWAKVCGVVSDAVDGVKSAIGGGIDTAKDVAQNTAYKVSGGKLGTGGSDAAKAEMIKAMDAGGITDPNSKAMLMANADHESQGFTKKGENLNYSASRLQEIFPKYYKTPEDAARDAGNPEAIANKVYGGRMGNTETGDGHKYRGRGSLQLTGKANYEAMGKQLGIDLVNNPDLAMDPAISAKIAVAYWKKSGADAAAKRGDSKAARIAVNGGTNGIDDVDSKTAAYMAQAKAGDLTPTRIGDDVRVAPPTGATEAINSTMGAVKRGMAAPQPIGVLPMSAPVTPSAASSTQPGAGIRLSTSAPASVSSLKAPSYISPAPDASTAKIPATPEVSKPAMYDSKDRGAVPAQAATPLSQNLEDRQIAHAASGGIGMNSKI